MPLSRRSGNQPGSLHAPHRRSDFHPDERLRDPASSSKSGRVAGLVCPFVHAEALAAMLKHFRHEWQALQLSRPVQGLQDLFLAANFNALSNA